MADSNSIYFMDAIGGTSENCPLLIDLEFHHDDARMSRIQAANRTDAQTQINYRDRLPSHVHHASHVHWGSEHLGNLRYLEDLTHSCNINGEEFIPSFKVMY